MKGPATIGGDHCLAPERTVDAPIDDGAGRYARLFPDLRPIEADNAALLALGVAGGICDAGEECADAVETAAGWPMFGQYVAHDITADRSPIGPQARAAGIVNFRTPRANLESLYGSGQIGSPYLFRAEDPGLLLLGTNDRGEPADRRHPGPVLDRAGVRRPRRRRASRPGRRADRRRGVDGPDRRRSGIIPSGRAPVDADFAFAG